MSTQIQEGVRHHCNVQDSEGMRGSIKNVELFKTNHGIFPVYFFPSNIGCIISSLVLIA